jgi:hypothetical protein
MHLAQFPVQVSTNGCRCCTATTTSQHCFLPGASSTFARPYPVSCWHPHDLLTAHHVVRSAHHALCSKGELSGLFLIVHQRIPNGILGCHSSQRGISIAPSSFCNWGCCQRLSMLGAIWSYFLQNGSYILVFSCSILRAAGSQLATATAITARTYLTPAPPRLCASGYTLLGLVIAKEHRHCCFQPWRCLQVKLYSCRRRIQQAVWPSRFLKLVTQVNVEWSVHRCNSCP